MKLGARGGCLVGLLDILKAFIPTLFFRLINPKVSITPDALPDVNLTGEVISISNTFQEVRGDITYLVKIKLDNIDPNMRWGMTVVIDFEDKP